MWKLSEDFICRQVCGETLLMPVGGRTKDFNGIFTLSETAALLLREFEKGADEKAAASALAAEFSVDAATALEDTQAFADQLRQYGILQEAEEQR